MRGVPQSDGSHVPPETRIFQSSGWLNPQPVVESANENALTPPQNSTRAIGLEPFTEYEFCVSAVNMAGSTLSHWISERTAEAGNLVILSPFSLPQPHIYFF